MVCRYWPHLARFVFASVILCLSLPAIVSSKMSTTSAPSVVRIRAHFARLKVQYAFQYEVRAGDKVLASFLLKEVTQNGKRLVDAAGPYDCSLIWKPERISSLIDDHDVQELSGQLATRPLKRNVTVGSWAEILIRDSSQTVLVSDYNTIFAKDLDQRYYAVCRSLWQRVYDTLKLDGSLNNSKSKVAVEYIAGLRAAAPGTGR